ncbi:MAG: hypothetical protein K1Y36_29255 [Blastocatellia bacterium]|nr:hypothetical protein [Blastocatellia bacterium]
MPNPIPFQRNGRFFQLPVMYGAVGLGNSLNHFQDVRMIQSMLNQALANGHISGTALSITGAINVPTIQLIQKFQQAFPAFLGRETKGFVLPESKTLTQLVIASQTKIPTQPSVPNPPKDQLPGTGGPGFYRYSPRTGENLAADGTLMSSAKPAVISAMVELAAQWNNRHPSHPIGIGDMSGPDGKGDWSRHPGSGHAGGNIIDVRPMTKNGGSGNQGKTQIGANSYDRALTSELVQLLFQSGKVKTILFNDGQIKGVHFAKGHDDHLHIVFSL